MHSGQLENGDYVVVLLNAASTAMTLNATAAEIFLDQGGKKSTEAKSSWDVYDLWGDRMPEAVAKMVVSGNVTVQAANATGYLWNATRMSYGDGVARNESMLFGKRIGEMGAGGMVQGSVPAHVS